MAVFIDAAELGNAADRALEFGPGAGALAYFGADAPPVPGCRSGSREIWWSATPARRPHRPTPPPSAVAVIEGLRRADSHLRSDAHLHAQRWFTDYAARTLTRIRAVPEGSQTTLDDLALVPEVLAAALES